MIDQVPGQESFDSFVIRMDDVSFSLRCQCVYTHVYRCLIKPAALKAAKLICL